MEQNYVAKVLLALAKDENFFSQKNKNFSIGLSENDIKKVKNYCLDNNLIEKNDKNYTISVKGLKLIKNYKDKLRITNIEYLKVEKTPPTLTKAIRALARHLIEDEVLKKDSLEENLKKELLNFRELKKEVENYIYNRKEINLEEYFDEFLSKGLTKSIVSILLLNFLAKYKNEFAFYEKNQFELDFTPLMFDRMVVNPKNFEIKKVVLNSSFLNEKINILKETKKLILKFQSLEKIALKTNFLSPKTLKFKNIVLNAKDPMQLYLRDLEKIFKNKEEFSDSIVELENFYINLIQELEKFVLVEFRTDSLFNLKNRFDRIKQFINNKELLILGNNLVSIERFSTYINQKRVPRDWDDLDISNFKLKTKELAQIFLIIESTIDSSGCAIETVTQNLVNEISKLDRIQKNILLRKVVQID